MVPLEPWEFGTMAIWDHGNFEPWDFGQWDFGQWDFGTMGGPCDFVTLGLGKPWDFGTMGLWDNVTLGSLLGHSLHCAGQIGYYS